MGRMINLFKKDPFVIFHKTGSSLDETKPEAFSALTAKSSAKDACCFLGCDLTHSRYIIHEHCYVIK